MEGLYLFMLIYKTMLTERKGVKLYIILGWGEFFPRDGIASLVQDTMHDVLQSPVYQTVGLHLINNSYL